MLARIRNMSIQNKLLSSAGLSLILLLVVWTLIAKIISESDHTFKQAKDRIELADAVGNTAKAVQRISEPIANIFHSWNTLIAKKEFARNYQIYQGESQILQVLLKNDENAKITQNNKKAEEYIVKISDLAENVFLFADIKVTAEGEGRIFAAQAAMEEVSIFISEINGITLQILDLMKDSEVLIRDKTTNLFKGSLIKNKRFSHMSMIVLLTSIILTTLVSYLVARSVSRPTKALQKAVKAVSQGDLTYVLDIESYGEIGELVHSFSIMVDSQRQLVSEVKNSSKKIALASDELSEFSQKMTLNSENTEKLAEAVSEASAATDTNVQAVAGAAGEMLMTIKEISRNIQEESGIATGAVSLSKTTNDTMQKLDDSSQKVGEIVKVIRSIAEQTNLLALNATIEAARAGETGKGFAVVANEVKELAHRTSTETEEISQAILAIQEDTQGAIKATGGISKVIEQINDISASVASAIEEQSVVMEEITRNMGEAASGSKRILESNSGVAEASKNTAGEAENILQASQSLSKMGEEFLVLVGRFKV